MVNDWLIPGIRTGRALASRSSRLRSVLVGVDFVTLRTGSLGRLCLLGLGIGGNLDAMQDVDRGFVLQILAVVVRNISRRAAAFLAFRFILYIAREARPTAWRIILDRELTRRPLLGDRCAIA